MQLAQLQELMVLEGLTPRARLQLQRLSLLQADEMQEVRFPLAGHPWRTTQAHSSPSPREKCGLQPFTVSAQRVIHMHMNAFG